MTGNAKVAGGQPSAAGPQPEGEASALAAVTWQLRGIVARMQMSDLDRLREFATVGRLLLDAKDMIGPSPKGAFGQWCDANFPTSKEWRARLMKLAREWDDFTKAEAWARGKGRVLTSRDYSVDGALALVAEWRVKRDAPAAGSVRGTPPGKREGSRKGNAGARGGALAGQRGRASGQARKGR